MISATQAAADNCLRLSRSSNDVGAPSRLSLEITPPPDAISRLRGDGSESL
jgi:hypothetical protein